MYCFGRKLVSVSNIILGKALDISLRRYGGSDIVAPPIFIIGAPRTGSTLLIQSIAGSFDIGFLANAHAFLSGLQRSLSLCIKPTKKIPFKTMHLYTG